MRTMITLRFESMSTTHRLQALLTPRPAPHQQPNGRRSTWAAQSPRNAATSAVVLGPGTSRTGRCQGDAIKRAALGLTSQDTGEEDAAQMASHARRATTILREVRWK